MEMDNETKEKISQLQLFEQNINALLGKKQQFQSQLMEVESALEELDSSKKTYKIVGNIMVLSNKKDLKEDLESKKEKLNLRLNSLSKQEDRIRKKAKDLQQEVLSQMESD